MSKKLALLTAFVMVFLFAGPILAQAPSADEINQIARQLNCPTCAGLNLEDCNTQTCFQWREQIGDLLAQGYTEQQVLDWYVERYGEHVLQEPARRGVALYVWLLPVVVVLAGGIWVGFLLKNWSAGKQAQPITVTASSDSTDRPSAAEVHDEYLHQVEQDLKDL
jgi:cytochrome c-type biogenesis protein CcmH